MSILSRLCRYVGTYGYSSTPCEPFGSRKHKKGMSRQERYARACIEEMEPRILLTTLTHTGQGIASATYFDSSKKNITVTISGNITVEMYGDNADTLVDLIPGSFPPATAPLFGLDIFAMYITSSDINAYVAVNGVDIYAGGPPSLYTGSTGGGGLPIPVPGGIGQVWIGQLANGTPISNIPTTTATNGAILSPAAQALATSTNGFDGTFYRSGIYSANSIGKILIDGTITGNVDIEGSIGSLYAGWLATGDVTNGNDFNSVAQPNNFHVSGDLGALYVQTDVGVNVATIPSGGATFDALTQIQVDGRIGTINVGGALAASITADSTPSVSLTALGYQWTEATSFVVPNNLGNRVRTFASGLIPITGAGDPLFNNTLAKATYVGTLDFSTGSPTISLTGILQGLVGGATPNPIDYYSFGVLAGQTVTASMSALATGLQFGVFDADGRLIFSTTTNVSGVASITFKADKPGAYHLAIGLPGDRALIGAPGVFETIAYTAKVTGLTNMAIGGIQSGGDIYLEDPGVTVPTGDLGGIVAGGSLLSNSFLGTSVINVGAGNLLEMAGHTIGNSTTVLSEFPTVTVDGEIGFIRATATLYASVFATGDIQVIAAGADLEGTYVTNRALGVLRAGSFLARAGTGFATVQVNADGIGNDGIIDLIDIAGNLGEIGGGPRIETGQGGNVRFMQVGGSIFQDPAFGGSGTGTVGSQFGDGGIVYSPGEVVSITDDSGAVLTITPARATSVTNPITGVVTTTPGGSITTYTYGIYGTGGSAIVKLIANGNVTITSSSSSGAPGQSVEIGQLIDTGTGAALTTTTVGGNTTIVGNGTIGGNVTTVTTGGVVLPANDATAVATSLNAITIAGTILTDVFNVVTEGGTINSITNRTGGDLVNVTQGGPNASDIGTISVNGNIGSTRSTLGEAVNQIAVLNNAYPFNQQHTGIVANNIVSISATGSVGNIMAAGSVGSITADAGGGAVKNTPFGITGPVLVGGNLGTVNIGQGIGVSGESGFSSTNSYGASFSRAGIYAGGAIVSVVGNNADIRGDIISTATQVVAGVPPLGIENISLSNGSIIGVQIGVYGTIAQAGYLGGGVTIPILPGSNITSPLYAIQNVSVSGNGGIIGTTFIASNIGNIVVGPDGFGIINTLISGGGDGVTRSITAGGYGLRGVITNGNRILAINATGGGGSVSPAIFSNRVRGSETGTIDPYTGVPVTSDTDLTLFLSTPGLGDSDYREGVIGESTFQGISLGNVTAFSIQGIGPGFSGLGVTADTFDFANSIGSIVVRAGVLDVRLITGSIGNFTIGGNANGLDLEVAGAIGTVFIGGNFDSSSTIIGKGPSSSIKSLTVVGNFAGTLVSQGFVNTLIIGGSTKKGSINVGTFSGTIQLLGGSSAKNLVFAAGFSGDFEVGGSVGSISFLQGLSSTAALVVHGSLGSLTIGGDKTKNLGLAGHVTIQGTLGQLLGGGAFTGSIITTGNLGKVKYGGSFGGSTTVNGSIGSFTLTGDVVGSVVANGSIGPVKLTGNVTSTGSFSSNAGSISNFTINKGGTLDGLLKAGVISKVMLPSIGANGKIIGNVLSGVTVRGNVTGALIRANSVLSSLAIGGTVTNSVITAGQSIASLGVRGGVTSSVIQSGITAGNDGIYGTNDTGETLGFGSIGKMSLGGLTNSVVAAGGPIGSFISGGLFDSSVSSGLVLNGAALQAVVAGTNPLSTPANVDTLRTNPTLLFGNIGSISIANGAEGGLDANSAISAGISPGADGIFQASDISNPQAVPGTSTILKLKLAADEFGQVFQHNPA